MDRVKITSLSHLQQLVIVLLIANFWYSGVLLVSNINYYFEWNLIVLIILSALSYPFAVISIRGVEWIVKLKPGESHQPVTLITLAVSLMHVIALFFVPNLYTVSGIAQTLATGWLTVFGVTVVLASYRKSKTTNV